MIRATIMIITTTIKDATMVEVYHWVEQQNELSAGGSDLSKKVTARLDKSSMYLILLLLH